MKWLLPPILWLSSIAAMGLACYLLPTQAIVPAPYQFAGYLLFALGLGIAILASRQFGRVGTNINTFRDPDTLVTDGLFSVSRNPMYLGFVLSLLGAAIVVNDLVALSVTALFFAVTNAWYIPFEERAASTRFGGEFDAYSKRVRRWI
jgi:protein-S-isoprenylcysteine O-methyltransferase Ste14